MRLLFSIEADTRAQEYFLKLPAAPYTLPGFHVSSLPDDRQYRHFLPNCI